MIDNLAILAIGAFGWGLSLSTYRIFARQNGWPMGSLHNDLPAVPAIIGLFALFVALMFAAARGAAEGGWIIVLFGLLLAVFWTGFLRVGSQISLVLAPVATVLLLLGWISDPAPHVRISLSDAPALENPAEASPGAVPLVERNEPRNAPGRGPG